MSKSNKCPHNLEDIDFDKGVFDGDSVTYTGTCTCGLKVRQVYGIHPLRLEDEDGNELYEIEE
jgi:hypothetical protein